MGTNKKVLMQFVEDLKKELNLTVDEESNDYPSCKVVYSNDRKRAWIGQPHLIKKLENEFKEDIKGRKRTQSPGTPNRKVMRPKEDQKETSLDDKPQKRHQTGCGLPLHPVKHSRPDISNIVQELLKCLGAATKEAMDKMH